MPAVPFHYVELRAFCYATEDEKRVERALRTFLPADGESDGADTDQIELTRDATEGFHGDRILVLSVRLENADDVRHVLSKVAELPELDRVLDELDERVDENCALFLHLDKQAAFRGEVRLGEGVVLRAKVEAYPAKRETAVENTREAFRSL